METNRLDNARYWLGLGSYDERDASIFFGRDEEIKKIFENIVNNPQNILYGQSGIGKTSILRAGVFPLLRNINFFPVYIRLDYQSDISLYIQIIDLIANTANLNDIDIEQTVKYCYDDCRSLWEYFHCNTFWNSSNYPVTPVLVFDQFEEIFTLCKSKQERDDFFVQLADLIDNRIPEYIEEYLNNDNNENIIHSQDSNFRVVITLREDFLARFEEYTDSIPALKRNRHCLKKLTWDQAKEVVMRPNPGLVSSDVADEILKTVAGEQKVSENDEITIEPSILSLVCSELDKERRQRGLTLIDSNLLLDFGDHIIYNFYIRSVGALGESKEIILEDLLLTPEGFRDSISYSKLLNHGITDDDLSYLIDCRIARIESRRNDFRVEFTHDVLSKIANKRRKEREKNKQIKAAQKKKNRYVILVSLLILGVITSSFILFFNYKKNHAPKTIIQTIPATNGITAIDLIFETDTTSSTIYDSWTAILSVTNGQNINIKDTISNLDCYDKPYKIKNIDSNSDVIVKLSFIDSLNYNNFKNVSKNFVPSEIIANNGILPIPLIRESKTVSGRVYFRDGDIEIPIRNIQVVTNGKVGRTDENGYFKMFVSKNADVRDITCTDIKSSYISLDTIENKNDSYNIRYIPSKKLQVFYKLCSNIYDYVRYNMATKQKSYMYRYPTNIANDSIIIYYRKTKNDQCVGYFFRQKDSLNYINKPELSYYYFTGKIEPKYDDFELRYMTLFGKDALGNEMTLRSVIKQRTCYILVSTPYGKEEILTSIKGICTQCKSQNQNTSVTVEDNDVECKNGHKLPK